MHKKITIEKADVLKSIYFIAEMSQNTGEKGMYGGLAGKSDSMGGIFDRWINQIPESIIFNKYILEEISHGKNVEVVVDFYKYKPRQETTGIAPDVIGLKINDKVIPFVTYDNRWVEEEGKPQIEVKTFKSTQKMLSLRNQGYEGKYLVMVETSFRTDYLLPFFDKNLFSEEVYHNMIMNDDVFIKNKNEYLHHLNRVRTEQEDLGSIKLICITETSLFTKLANYCGPGISPIRIDSIKEYVGRINNVAEEVKLSQCCSLLETGLYRFDESWFDEENKKHLDFYCSDINFVSIVKKNKGSLYIKVSNDCIFNDEQLKSGKIYKIDFVELNRKSSKEGEYFLQKSLTERIVSKEKELKGILEKIIIEEK